MTVQSHCTHLLRFKPLHHAGSGVAFPCNGAGQVPLDELSDRVRTEYLYARAVMGREYGRPLVETCETCEV